MIKPAITEITNNEIPKTNEIMTTIRFAISSNCMSNPRIFNYYFLGNFLKLLGLDSRC